MTLRRSVIVPPKPIDERLLRDRLKLHKQRLRDQASLGRSVDPLDVLELVSDIERALRWRR